MVTRYDVIRKRWSSHFWVKVHVLTPFLKVNLVGKIMQSAYLCVMFHLNSKKSPFLAVLTWFLILGKIQDDDHCWWRHWPPAVPLPIKYTSSCREAQRLSTKGKTVSKYCNISKTLGGGGHPLPIVPLGGGGMYVQGLIHFAPRRNRPQMAKTEIPNATAPTPPPRPR